MAVEVYLRGRLLSPDFLYADRPRLGAFLGFDCEFVFLGLVLPIRFTLSIGAFVNRWLCLTFDLFSSVVPRRRSVLDSPC